MSPQQTTWVGQLDWAGSCPDAGAEILPSSQLHAQAGPEAHIVKHFIKGVFPICSQGSVHLALSVPQLEGPTVGSRSKGDLNAIVTRLNTS